MHQNRQDWPSGDLAVEAGSSSRVLLDQNGVRPRMSDRFLAVEASFRSFERYIEEET